MRMKNKEPLHGVRVLELGSMAAGPFCGRLLGDFGAEVIKIEQPDGDPGRFLGEHYRGISLQGKSIMRNKKLVCVDLRKTEGQEIVRRLAEKSDVILENFRPGTLEKWGLGYEQLRRVNPGIVMTRISGYGQYGPYSGLPGYGATCEALSGLRHMTGDPDRPPARVAVPLTDFLSGVYGAFGTLMALRHRDETGEGQCIDLALYEAAFSFMHAFVPTYEVLGKTGNRAGSRLPNMTPNNLYLTKDKKYFLIAAGSQPMFRRLAAAMGRPELVDDPKFATQATRSRNEDELDEIVGEWARRYTMDELRDLLHTAAVACGPVYTMAEIFNDVHYRARDMLVRVPDEDFGSLTLSGVIPKLGRTPGAVKWSGGSLGRDTCEVLRDALGMSDEQLEGLQSRDVIRQAARTRSTGTAPFA